MKEPFEPLEPWHAVGLAECCRFLGISRRMGERLVRDGSFPIPELPRLGTTKRGGRRTYSTYEIDLYLRELHDHDRAPLRVAGARR